jgi:hypothetical protein
MIQVGSIHEDFSRDLYWVEITTSDRGEYHRSQQLYACVSWEWLCDRFLTHEVTRDHLESWIEIVKKDAEDSRGNLVYAVTDEGDKQGLFFLEELSRNSLSFA